MSPLGFFAPPFRWILARFAVLLISGTQLCATLPEPWNDTDVGSVGTPGGAAYDPATGAYTIQGAGAEIGGTADNFHFAYRPLSGDGCIIARIGSLTNTSSSAKAGVMIRETLAADARNALLMVTPGIGAGLKWRSSTGGAASQVLVSGIQAPHWVKLERRGKMVTGYASGDGVTWNVVQRAALSMTADVYIGLAACSRTSGLTTAVADQVTIDTPDAGVSLPWPWTETTVGSPAEAGVALYDGSYVLSNLGADIWGTADKMKYVSQTLTGDGALTLQVSSVTSNDNSSRLGLMMRESLNATARHVFLGVNTSKAMVFLSRRTTGGTTATRAASLTVAVPAWIRLQRSGNLFTAWRSTDGVNWTAHGTETLDLGPTLHVGAAYSNRSASTWAIGVGDELKLTTPADTDGNGLDDTWELHYFGGIGANPQADPDGDGLGNDQEWELGNDPLVFNLEGQRPLLEVASGDNQTGIAGTVLPQPLVVRVKDSLSGASLANIPVLLRVTQGAGLLGSPTSGFPALSLFSDSTGLVQSPFLLPLTAGTSLVGASIGGRQQASVVAFNLKALAGEAPLLLDSADIGAPALPGQVQYQDGTYTLTSATTGNTGTSDNSTLAWMDFTGDGYILARTTFVDATDPLAQAGVMIRENLDANARNVAMLLTPGNGVAFQWRDTAGGFTEVVRTSGVSGPTWLLLRRSGNTLTGFYSTDGQTWLVGGTRTLALGANVKAGFTLGTKTTVYNRATFDGFLLAPHAQAPWQMADIGSPKATSVDDYSEDSILIRAGGADIAVNADAFHYVYQPLIGDARLVARVATQLVTHANTKSSLMIRESLAAGSRHVTLMLTPSGGVTLRARTQTDGTTITLGNIPSVSAPYWLKLDRLGSRIDAYASSDGGTWASVGSITFDPGAAPLIGLAAASNNATAHTQTLLDRLHLEQGDGARGWNGAYFEGTSFDSPRAYRRDATIDFHWPATQSPAPGLPAQGYSVRWEGDLVPAHSETYTFTALSQGSARIAINGQVIVNRWTAHALSEAAGSVALQAGQPVRLVVDYANTSGDGRIQLRWSSASQPDAPVPFTSVQAIDADDDGISDTWETARGLNPHNPSDAALDPDDDGLSNLLEYRLGGDPVLADDRLPGAVVMEEWSGITGDLVRDLSRNTEFFGAPDSRRSLTSLDAPQDRGDHYGARVRGYIVPPATGAYRFWVSANQSAEFWISSDDSPFNRTKIARVSQGATDYRAYAVRAEQRSQLVTLQAGHYYYFEVLHKESTLADHLTVAWTRPGATVREAVPGAALATYCGHQNDANGNGLPDTWESTHGLDDTNLTASARGAYGDADEDGLVNLLEYQHGTNPRLADTDGDDYADNLEAFVASNPLAASDLALSPWTLGEIGVGNSPALANRIGADAFQMAGMRMQIAQHRADSFPLLYRQVSGDFEFTTRVVRPASSPEGYAAVFVRSDLGDHARSITLLQDVTGHTRTLIRTSPTTDIAELAAFAPAYPNQTIEETGYWFRMRRVGDLLRLFYSTDGQRWMLSHSNTLALGEDCLIGMAVCYTTATGTSDTELAVRQFRDVRLITDYAAPATPEAVPPDATLSPVAVIDGNAGVPVKGQWTFDADGALSRTFTGTLDYIFTVPADGLYRLTFTAHSPSNPTASTLFPVEVSVDGQLIARVDLVLAVGEDGLVRVVTPWLKAGTHTVRLFYDNTLSYRPLRIRSLAVEQFGGLDADNNGRADWIDVRLAALNTLESLGSIYVSPASLSGRAFHRTLFALSADGSPVAVKPAPGFGWYADVPLSASAPVEVLGDFENSGRVEGLLLAWAPLNLFNLSAEDFPQRLIRVRKRDSLRFTAHPAAATTGAALVTIARAGSTPVEHEIADALAQPVTHAFEQAGTYTVTASYVDGANPPVAAEAFTVEVIEAAFASDPVIGLNNTPITWDNPLIFDNVLLEIDQGLLLAKQATLPTGGTRFALTSSNVNASYIIARLGENGPIFGHATVRGVRVATVSDTALDLLQVYPDGSQLIGVPIIVSPLTDDTRVEVEIFVQGVTFEDGTIVKILTKADFDQYGRVYLKFIYPAGLPSSICHRVKVYEGASYLGQF